MKLTRKNVSLPQVRREASFLPETYNKERNTIELVWSTGAAVKRYDWWEGESFYEELSMERKHVKLDRLNNGASVLNNHRSMDLKDVLGVVESARIDDGKGLATVRFSGREDVKSIVQDIIDGVIRNISVGYRVHAFEELAEKRDDMRVFRATDWEPMEISFVTIPADAGAQVRNETKDELYNCNLLLRSESMSVKNENPGAAPEVKPQVDAELVARQAVEAERLRVSEITEACGKLKFDGAFAQRMIAEGVSVDQARKLMIEELAKRDEAAPTKTGNATITRDESETRLRGFEDVLNHRANPTRNKLTDCGREFRGMSLSDMVRVCLEAQGVRTSGMSKDEMVAKSIQLHQRGGAHTTSDFPNILANVINKSLRDSYAAQAKTFSSFVREVTVPDFKTISRVALGDAPALEALAENGDIKSGTISEKAESYNVETYAKMVRISRKAIVNDDLDAFTRLPEAFGRRAAEKEGDLVYALLLANAALSDSIALFHASHNNLSSGGAAAISVASLGAARSAMRKQAGIDGGRIDLTPVTLLVPPELEMVAEQFIAQNVVPSAAGSVNPFAGRLSLAVESRLSDSSLTGYSATAWYLMAALGAVDMIELAKLVGQEAPTISSEELFDTEGVKIKCRYDLGAKVIDYRGMNKNAGA